MPRRLPRIVHATSMPCCFVGRQAELELLDRAAAGGLASLVALVGPGGQGKTAVVQHWLARRADAVPPLDGVFLWSFYRGRDADLCLRSLYAYAQGLEVLSDVSASNIVDTLIPLLRAERWAIVLDGLELVQADAPPWPGRILHPELDRLVGELASAGMPGVLVVTSRFALRDHEHRRHGQLISLQRLDAASAVALLRGMGATGGEGELTAAVEWCAGHAKAVELLASFAARYRGGDISCWQRIAAVPCATEGDLSPEELAVLRVLRAFQEELSAEFLDVLALATAFREPPTEGRLVDYLLSEPVRALLHDRWGRAYPPFRERAADWLAGCLDELVELRLLERVAPAFTVAEGAGMVIEAHPLVRRGFERALGPVQCQAGAAARAGFLRSRPDRGRPLSLADTAADVELFHACIEASCFEEADRIFVSLDNPKHRFLAPAFERDLLLSFFPARDWRFPPLWAGFGRYRSLAICLEMLGQFEEALDAYRPADAPLRGDALLALGRLGPLLEQERVAGPWQSLWSAYRAHALALAGQTDAAHRLALSLVPLDIYEWVHVFEALLRAGGLERLDLSALLYRSAGAAEHRWADLARRRLAADHARVCGSSAAATASLGTLYVDLIEEYDRAGLIVERVLGRLGLAQLLLAEGKLERAAGVLRAGQDITARHAMPILQADVLSLTAEWARRSGDRELAHRAARQADDLRRAAGYHAPPRP